VPYGHDASLIGARRATGPLGSTKIVLYAGGYGPRKRVEVAIEGMRRVVKILPTARLVLVGDPPLTIRRLIRELRLDDHVEMPGRINDSQLRLRYSMADAAVYCSEYEGFGFPALDALSAGVPLVACRSSSIPELVGDCAWLVPVGDALAVADALVDVLQGSSHVESRTEAGVRRARQFTWWRTWHAHVQVYREASMIARSAACSRA